MTKYLRKENTTNLYICQASCKTIKLSIRCWQLYVQADFRLDENYPYIFHYNFQAENFHKDVRLRFPHNFA